MSKWERNEFECRFHTMFQRTLDVSSYDAHLYFTNSSYSEQVESKGLSLLCKMLGVNPPECEDSLTKLMEKLKL